MKTKHTCKLQYSTYLEFLCEYVRGPRERSS